MAVEIEVEGYESLREGTCQVIAEAGANHNNSVDRAIEMAERAVEAGAWGVKFQLYKAETISVQASPKYWTDAIGTSTQFEAFKLSDKLEYRAYGAVAQACADLGIVFFATPFDLPAVDALEDIGAPIYKIASADITHRPLLEAVAQTGKPVLLSTGAATLEEVRNAIEWMGLGPDKLVPLVCTLTYPTPDEDGHFARIEEFRREFAPYLIGMSDHTLGTAGASMTAALGGVCIEKHYTLDPGLPDIPDHAMSVTPEQLGEMVQICDRAALLRGQRDIGVRDSELPARANARRSIVLERDVDEGYVLTPDDLGFKRPGTGIPPYELEKVIGRATTRAVAADTVLSEDDLR